MNHKSTTVWLDLVGFFHCSVGKGRESFLGRGSLSLSLFALFLQSKENSPRFLSCFLHQPFIQLHPHHLSPTPLCHTQNTHPHLHTLNQLPSLPSSLWQQKSLLFLKMRRRGQKERRIHPPKNKKTVFVLAFEAFFGRHSVSIG